MSAGGAAIAPAVTIPGNHSRMPSAPTEKNSRQFIAVIVMLSSENIRICLWTVCMKPSIASCA